jgi:hypothetical protein
MSPLRLWPRLAWDAAPRFLLASAAAAVLLFPLFVSARSDQSAMGVVASPGELPGVGILRFLLLGGTLIMWDGIASRPRREGHYRFLFTRPAPRWTHHLSAFSARLAWLSAFALLVGAAMERAGQPGSAAGAGTVGAALASGFVIGSLVLLASALVDRGDALLVAAFLVLEEGVRLGQADVSPAAALIARSLLSPLRAADALILGGLSGHAVPLERTMYACVPGIVALALGLLILQRRQLGPG